MSENKLEVIAKESQLPTTKSQSILEQFQGYFEIASEWESKVKAIVVTDENQKAEMELAREGRLFLKAARIDVEKTRVSLKAEALLESKAVDGMSNVLKALIVPLEKYLDKQEHFVEIREEEKREAKRQEIEKRIQQEEEAEQLRLAADTEKIRQDNEQLRKEAEERDRKDSIERKKRETRLANERAKVESETKAKDEELAKEREQRLKERMIAEDKSRRDRIKAAEKAQKLREVHERLAELTKNQITCPSCGHKFQLEEGK